MASSCITFPAREGLSSDINELASKWGYKQYGNGGYTAFIADVLDAVIQSEQTSHPEFKLETILEKKTKKDRK